MSTTARGAFQRAQERARAAEAAEMANERERIAGVLADPTTALRRLKARLAERRRNLRDPDHGTERYFPAYTGQPVADYIRTFQALNHIGSNPLTFNRVGDL